jgi:hypothetical protein
MNARTGYKELFGFQQMIQIAKMLICFVDAQLANTLHGMSLWPGYETDP